MNPVERRLQEEVQQFVAGRQPRRAIGRDLGVEKPKEGEDVLRVLRAIGGVVRLRRGKTACLPRADQRVEADEVDGFLEALAHFVSEARVEIVRAVRMAKGHQASIAARPAPKEIGTSPNVS